MDNESYDDKLHKGIYIPPENRELDISTNVDHWPGWILDEIEWFQFQGILEHTDFHAKGDKI